MSETTDVNARIDALDTAGTRISRATVLRHALGMENPLKSPSKTFLAAVLVELEDDEERPREELTRMFKAAKLKADAAEALGVDEIGTSVGPVISRTIALLEKEYDAPIAEIAEANAVDTEAFEDYEATITDSPFDER